MLTAVAESGAGPSTASGNLFRGIHHLAVNTEDMKKTVDFYVDVLGMPLVHAMRVPAGLGTGPNNRGNPPWENLRHYFFDMGNDSLLAFFEIPKGERAKVDPNCIAGMQHCAFSVTWENAKRIRAKLDALGVSYNGPVDALPGVQSTYFIDPNGIRLEMTTQLADGDTPQVINAVKQTREQALRELRTLSDDPAWLAHVGAQFAGK